MQQLFDEGNCLFDKQGFPINKDISETHIFHLINKAFTNLGKQLNYFLEDGNYIKIVTSLEGHELADFMYNEFIIKLYESIKKYKNQISIFLVGKNKYLKTLPKKLTIYEKNGKQNCNWLTSILEKIYNKYPSENIIDENGIFMDDTIVFCDYWWRGLDKKVLKKNTETKTDLDPVGQINSSIIDEIFELAANNKDVIFIPYDLYVFENSVEYGTERENEDSTACRLVYPFTFSGDKVTTLYSFEDLILDDFSDDLLLAKDNNNKKVKKLVNKKNRMDKGSHVTYIY